MTVKEVSAFLKIPVSSIYELANKGKIPAVKFGRHWRFIEQDVLAYLHGMKPQAQEEQTPGDDSSYVVPERKEWGQSFERRKLPRLNTDWSGNFSCDLLAGDCPAEKVVIRNVGEEGVLMDTPHPQVLSLGDPVSLEFQIPEVGPGKIRVKGRIVFIHHNGLWSAGVKFRNVNSATREVIRHVVG